ncbi:ABC multidrug transporter [Colletotrichum karsti]|uniref:ABC multidrug transporter n=1 Tax=Colletotrichum karsti TaxID=1095194 RepID=A0A9P6LMD1_9PEZI|nr:ABC multidrug transporter [Colletotrichum karsti]KAF9878698.1 ABC multidrug transporter [Colletotrichum karsti]
MSCPTSSDQSFGPRVDPACRSFDFTLEFEDIFFACLPSALLVLLAPSRIVPLLRKPATFVVRSRLLVAKLAVLSAVLGLQLAFLALRIQISTFRTSASLGADVLAFIATLTVVVVSVLNHQRSLRPSTLISVYLSASVVLGIPRVRTIWLLGNSGPVPIVQALVFTLTFTALVLESIEAKSSLSESGFQYEKLATAEQRSGFWARTCFSWLANTFRTGYSKVISLADLPGLDPSLESRLLHKSLVAAWSKFFTFAQPFLINTTVTFVGQDRPDSNYGKGLIGAWALVYLGLTVSSSIYQYHNLRFTTRLRGGLIALIYQQTVHTREVDTGEITAVSLMGTDVERIYMSMSALHTVWGSLLDIAVASWLLGLQLSLACLAPIVLVLCFIIAMSRISVATKTAQVQWIEKIQKRLQATTTMLGEMKAVKMLGLSQVMSNNIQNLRGDEIETSKTFRKLLVATLLYSLTPITLAPIATFAIYVIISVFWKNETLLPAQAFTSIALVSLLTTPVVMFIQLLPQVIQSFGCFDRIQAFCEGPNDRVPESTTSRYSTTQISEATANAGADEPGVLKSQVIAFVGESFGWKNDQPILHDLNVDIERDSVTVIVGPVGSGKSTFLSAILGDLIAISSNAKTDAAAKQERESMAFCSQTPWLENGSIRKNILGVSSYEEKWYGSVTSACGLDADFQAVQKGDLTLVGSKGASLSGGQKQRIALARAVYSRRRVVVLDDVFSGMDARTAHHISIRLLGSDGLLRRQHYSVIIATHSHKIMSLADTMISLENVNSADAEDPSSMSHNDVRRKHGEKAVYQYYLRSAGWKAVTFYGVSVVAWMFFSEFSTVWVKWWSESNSAKANQSVGYYMGIYAMLGVLGTIGASLAAWFAFLDIITNTAMNLHSDLLKTTLSFSEDMQLLDMDLPSNLVNYTSTSVSALAKIIILAVFSQYLGITLPFLATVLYFLQRFYLQTSRQVRLLGIEAKAPLYTHFSESVAGVSTIRAFGWEKQYQERNYRHIDLSQRPNYTQSCIQAWLSFVLNLVVAVLAVTLVTIVVIWHDKFSAGSVGVSLVMVIGFSEILSRLIQSWTKLESSVGAVSRIRHFMSDTETEATSGRRSPPPQWPLAGSINFSGVVAYYGSHANPVLKGVSLSVQAGEHVAVCGRSGSGKTSLILSLLQMIDIKEGAIEIDSVDISTLVHTELRHCINVVSQDPFLMPGTIRFNINPFGPALDDEIFIRALERVGVWTLVREQGGLDQEMDVKTWSAGQKQLLCLARAMLRHCKILILDEAMSSVDSETEAVMQEIIDTEFPHCTVLAVMHRLKHVTSYDKVALIGDGQLLEFGEPAALISGETLFSELYRMNSV